LFLLSNIALSLCSLTEYDRAIAYATLEYIDSFRCQEKLELMIEKQKLSYQQAKITMQNSKSCGLIKETSLYKIKNFAYYSCFCTFHSPSILFLMGAYQSFKNGVLPHHGAYFDQNGAWPEWSQLFDEFVWQKEKAEMDKQKKSSRAKF
jgi:hypothetical protein